jgi:hypothetical protein
MVRPVSPEERAAFARKVRVVVIVLVGASAGLVALGAGGTPRQAGAAALVGLPAGAVIAWYVGAMGGSPAGRRSHDPEEGGGEHQRATGPGSADEETSPQGDAAEARSNRRGPR